MKKFKILLAAGADDEGGGGGADAEAKKAAAQASADLKTALEKARTEERAKLRAELDKLASDSKAALELMETTQAANVKLQASLDAIQKAQGEGGKLDVAALIKEVSDKAAKATETLFAGQIAALSGELTVMQLRDLRRELIEEAGEENVITSLISGKTEEELRASVEASKAAFEEAKSRLSKKTKKSDGDTNEDDNADDENEDADAPEAGGTAGSGSGGTGVGRTRVSPVLSTFKNMTTEQRAKNRQKALDELKKLYPKRRN